MYDHFEFSIDDVCFRIQYYENNVQLLVRVSDIVIFEQCMIIKTCTDVGHAIFHSPRTPL